MKALEIKNIDLSIEKIQKLVDKEIITNKVVKDKVEELKKKKNLEGVKRRYYDFLNDVLDKYSKENQFLKNIFKKNKEESNREYITYDYLAKFELFKNITSEKNIQYIIKDMENDVFVYGIIMLCECYYENKKDIKILVEDFVYHSLLSTILFNIYLANIDLYKSEKKEKLVIDQKNIGNLIQIKHYLGLKKNKKVAMRINDFFSPMGMDFYLDILKKNQKKFYKKEENITLSINNYLNKESYVKKVMLLLSQSKSDVEEDYNIKLGDLLGKMRENIYDTKISLMIQHVEKYYEELCNGRKELATFLSFIWQTLNQGMRRSITKRMKIFHNATIPFVKKYGDKETFKKLRDYVESKDHDKVILLYEFYESRLNSMNIGGNDINNMLKFCIKNDYPYFFKGKDYTYISDVFKSSTLLYTILDEEYRSISNEFDQSDEWKLKRRKKIEEAMQGLFEDIGKKKGSIERYLNFFFGGEPRPLKEDDFKIPYFYQLINSTNSLIKCLNIFNADLEKNIRLDKNQFESVYKSLQDIRNVGKEKQIVENNLLFINEDSELVLKMIGDQLIDSRDYFKGVQVKNDIIETNNNPEVKTSVARIISVHTPYVITLLFFQFLRFRVLPLIECIKDESIITKDMLKAYEKDFEKIQKLAVELKRFYKKVLPDGVKKPIDGEKHNLKVLIYHLFIKQVSIATIHGLIRKANVSSRDTREYNDALSSLKLIMKHFSIKLLSSYTRICLFEIKDRNPRRDEYIEKINQFYTVLNNDLKQFGINIDSAKVVWESEYVYGKQKYKPLNVRQYKDISGFLRKNISLENKSQDKDIVQKNNMFIEKIAQTSFNTQPTYRNLTSNEVSTEILNLIHELHFVERNIREYMALGVALRKINNVEDIKKIIDMFLDQGDEYKKDHELVFKKFKEEYQNVELVINYYLRLKIVGQIRRASLNDQKLTPEDHLDVLMKVLLPAIEERIKGNLYFEYKYDFNEIISVYKKYIDVILRKKWLITFVLDNYKNIHEFITELNSLFNQYKSYRELKDSTQIDSNLKYFCSTYYFLTYVHSDLMSNDLYKEKRDKEKMFITHIIEMHEKLKKHFMEIIKDIFNSANNKSL